LTIDKLHTSHVFPSFNKLFEMSMESCPYSKCLLLDAYGGHILCDVGEHWIHKDCAESSDLNLGGCFSSSAKKKPCPEFWICYDCKLSLKGLLAQSNQLLVALQCITELKKELDDMKSLITAMEKSKPSSQSFLINESFYSLDGFFDFRSI